MNTHTKATVFALATAAALFGGWFILLRAATETLNTVPLTTPLFALMAVNAICTGWIIGRIALWVARKATGHPAGATR